MRESAAGMDFERGVIKAVERLVIRQPFSDSPPHAHQHPCHRFCRPRFSLKCSVRGPSGSLTHPAPARAGAWSPDMIVECGLAGLYTQFGEISELYVVPVSGHRGLFLTGPGQQNMDLASKVAKRL